MSALAATLLEKIQSRRARTGVVGLGYVGLPLAVELAKAGFHATGIDLDDRKIEAINEGRSYIPDVPTADVQALTQGRQARRDHRLRRRHGARHDQHLRADAAAQDEGPRHVLHRLGASRRSPSTCTRACSSCLESTTYPGTTDEVVQPLLEATGLKAGRRLLPRLLARARRPGQPDVPDAATSRRSSAA